MDDQSKLADVPIREEPLTPSQWLALIVPVGMGLGMLHAFGFWGGFGLNPLEFVSLADLAKLSAKPLAALVMLLFLGSVFGTIAARGIVSFHSPELPIALAVVRTASSRDAGPTVFGIEFKGWVGSARAVVLAVLSVAAGVAYIAASSAVHFYVVAMLVAAMVWLLPEKWLGFLPHFRVWRVAPWVKRNVLFLAISYAGIVFTSARFDAENGVRQQLFPIVDVERSNLDVSSDIETPVAYLGRLTDTYVLIELGSNRLILLQADKAPALHLVPAKRVESASNDWLFPFQTQTGEDGPAPATDAPVSPMPREGTVTPTPTPAASQPPADEPR